MVVLIAEDDELILKTIEHKLKKENYEVILARNGKEAIENLTTSKIDFIITDIMMPIASGTEVLSATKRCPDSRNYSFKPGPGRSGARCI